MDQSAEEIRFERENIWNRPRLWWKYVSSTVSEEHRYIFILLLWLGLAHLFHIPSVMCHGADSYRTSSFPFELHALALLRDQGNPCRAKPHEEGKTESQCDWKKDQRSVTQHALERGAHQGAWQNWCVSMISLLSVCVYLFLLVL